MHQSAERKQLNRVILVIGFVVYAGFNLFLLTRHQAYRDEANVWLMAKYLSPAGLLREIHYQGHPCLWYFLAMPFAKAGLPYRTIEVLSFLVMMVTAGIFLAKAKVHTAVKLLFLASPFCTYFYPVIARNYCLIALLMMICAWLYPARNGRPFAYGLVLGLLVQADTIAIATAGALSLAWLCENAAADLRQKRWQHTITAAKGLWIPLASLLFWMLQMRNVSDCQAYEIKWQGIGSLLWCVREYSLRIMARLTGWNTLYIVCFAALLLSACAWIARITGNIIPLFIMLMTYLFQVVFSALVYELHIWHFLSLGFVMMWMLWIQNDALEKAERSVRSGKAAVLLTELMAAVLAVCMILHWNSDQESSNLDRALHEPYSDGYGTACFVQANIPEDALIITANVAMSSSVLAYLDGYEFVCAGSGLPAWYATWSREELRTVSFDELDAWVNDAHAGVGEYYVIQTVFSCLEGAVPETYEMIYHTPQDTTKNEEYTIYRVVREM